MICSERKDRNKFYHLTEDEKELEIGQLFFVDYLDEILEVREIKVEDPFMCSKYCVLNRWCSKGEITPMCQSGKRKDEKDVYFSIWQ